VITPDDEVKPDGKPVLFVSRWNALVGALLVEPSIKLVALQAAQYGIAAGDDIYPGNERLARQTGLSEKTVREAWHFLRATGMAYRNAHSAWTGERRTADLYELAIPEHWKAFAVLGPHSGKFTCQQCGKKFNPQPCNVFRTERDRPVINPETGNREVRWRLQHATFCPTPRGERGCVSDWCAANGAWGGDGAWELFRKARNDEW
jgi:hypothetical protein